MFYEQCTLICVWEYLESVVCSVFTLHSQAYTSCCKSSLTWALDNTHTHSLDSTCIWHTPAKMKMVYNGYYSLIHRHRHRNISCDSDYKHTIRHILLHLITNRTRMWKKPPPHKNALEQQAWAERKIEHRQSMFHTIICVTEKPFCAAVCTHSNGNRTKFFVFLRCRCCSCCCCFFSSLWVKVIAIILCRFLRARAFWYAKLNQ